MNANQFKEWLASSPRRTLVMGIVNATPDSFSDAGQFHGAADAISHARDLIAQGADLLDIGGESTRPGSKRIDAQGQLDRTMPVTEAIRRESDVAISIDTTLAKVAEQAIRAGANILNDVSAATEDPGMLPLAARTRTPIILMHMKGEPGTMQVNPTYVDVTREVGEYLAARAGAAIEAGIAREQVVLDPGIGFGKTMDHNLQLLRELPQLVRLGFAVLIGTSRKAFIGKITGVEKPGERVIGSCVSAAWAITQGASIIRVHDVAPAVQTVRMIEAIMGPRQS